MARGALLALLPIVLGTQPAAAQDRYEFADAMQHHRPLARIAGAPGPLARASREDARREEARFARAVDYAQAMDSYALLIWQGGKLRLERYFAPYDAALTPESASMHKSVMALLVAAAIADGKIASVDDPIGKYVTEWAGDPRGAITLRQVLTMSAGLNPPDMAALADGARARAAVLGMRITSPPDAHFAYSNALSQLMVIVLESATGTPYADYLSRRLWRRVHADDAYVWLNEPDGFPRGHSALMARATDWLRVGLLIKNRGRVGHDQVIPAALIDQMTAPSRTNPNYGWQVWRGATWHRQRFYNDARTGFSVLASAPFAIDDLVYFDGFGGQRVYISRSRDLVIVRQGKLRPDWDDAMLPNLIAEALR